MTDPGGLFAKPLPTLVAHRLLLRAFVPDDAPDVRRYLAEETVARNTLTIPHP